MGSINSDDLQVSMVAGLLPSCVAWISDDSVVTSRRKHDTERTTGALGEDDALRRSCSVESPERSSHGEPASHARHQQGTIMTFILQPWQLYFLILAGWINRQQQEVIEYLRTENQVLKEKFGKKRILLNDDQRRRLAVKGKILGRKRLEEIGTLFTPDTILRWHRMLIAKKRDYSERRKSVGRPPVSQEIIEPGNEVGRGEGEVLRRERLGGILRYCHRDAA